MTTTTRYATTSAARGDFKHFLDAAFSDQVVTVSRDTHTAALVDANRLREFLAQTISADAEVSFEDGAVVIVMPGRPFAVENNSLAEALDELVEVLREYALDWQLRLRHAVNHRENWGLVQLTCLSSDNELKHWLTAAPVE